MTRTVGLAGGAVLLAYSILSILTGRQLVALGDLAQMIPPLAYAALAMTLARRCRGQVRVFWNLNAIHGIVWAIGQGVWTFYDVGRRRRAGGADRPDLLRVLHSTGGSALRPARARSATLAIRHRAARPRPDRAVRGLCLHLLCRLDRRDRWLPSSCTTTTSGSCSMRETSLLAVWAVWVWRTSVSPAWRQMLGVYAAGLALTFVAGVISVFVDQSGPHAAGGLWDLLRMAPYAVMALAAAIAFDHKLFEPAGEAPQPDRLPLVSMIAITLLVAIPAIDEIARRLFVVSPQTESLRTRMALAMMIPFGVVVVVREFLSRRALIRASQELVSAREQLVQKEKLAAVGQLVSGVAHELNNPLQGVLGYAELMLAARPSARRGRRAEGHPRQRQPRRQHRPQPADLCRPDLVGARLAADQPRRQGCRGGARAAAAIVRHPDSRRDLRSAAARVHRSRPAPGRARQPDPERRERDRGPARRQQHRPRPFRGTHAPRSR